MDRVQWTTHLRMPLLRIRYTKNVICHGWLDYKHHYVESKNPKGQKIKSEKRIERKNICKLKINEKKKRITLSLLFGWREEPYMQQNSTGGRVFSKLPNSVLFSLSISTLSFHMWIIISRCTLRLNYMHVRQENTRPTQKQLKMKSKTI